MSLINIHTYPDHCLRKKAQQVMKFDNELALLTQNMAETMYEAPGIGLAAPQVNIDKRVVVIDVSEEKNDLKILINPEITYQDGQQEYEEGCLSIPGIFGMVERAAEIEVKAQDIEGNILEFQADGLLAICVQHEIDHLSKLKRDRIKKKIKKEARQST